MPKGGAVLAGLRAAQSTAVNPTIQPLGGSVSPLAAQYSQWTLGRTQQSTALPRDPIEFLTGAFGPLSPIQPVGIDTPPPDAERPEPRRWQYPVGWNMPVGMPGTEGLKLADFQTLRTYAEVYSVARACIQLRKDEMLGIGWDIGPTADAAKAMRGSSSAMADFGKRRDEALKFFTQPDPNYNDFTSWFSAALEDMFVIDALSVYLHPTRIPGKGLFGTDLGGLDIIDGSSVRPLLDLRGGSPSPPNPAYQIYQYGIPRVDLMTMLAEQDIKDLGKPVAQYRGDQLLYLPRYPRTWTPYGQAPLERCIIPVITGLRKQQYSMDYYLEGSIPGVYISPGDPNMTPNQIREVQDSLNAIAGDVAYKHKVLMLPANSKVEPQKPPELADQSDEIIMTQVCMAYNVMPMELGISPRVSATQSTGAANQMAKASQDIQERKSLGPDLLWLKAALFDRILQDFCGQMDMEWKWDGLEEDEDEQTLTTLLVAQIGAGLSSIDEARIELGRQPWGLPITSDPGWAGQMGFTPLGQISLTGAPEPGVAPPTLPQPGQGGQPGTPFSPGGTTAGPPSGASPQSPMARIPAAGAAPQQANAGPATAKPTPFPGGTPAHAAAQAIASAEHAHPIPKMAGELAASTLANAGTVDPPTNGKYKATLSELDALRRHLHKGRQISTWERRHIPGSTLASISEDLAKGLSIDQAVDVAAALLPKVIEGTILKVGPEGFIHGYVCVRPPCGKIGDAVDHSVHGPGVVTHVDDNGTMHARFADGTEGKLGKPKTSMESAVRQRRIDAAVAQAMHPQGRGDEAVLPWTRGADPEESAQRLQEATAKAPHELTDEDVQGLTYEDSLKLLTHVAHGSHEYSEERIDKAVNDLQQQMHELKDMAQREIKDEHDIELLKATKQKFFWHTGMVLGGIAVGLASIPLAGLPAIVALVSGALGAFPGLGMELVDLIRKW